MKRIHIHIAVDNLADSVRFYSSLFAHEPTVQKVDYVKWMLDDPRVNFAISQRGVESGLNHLGIQVESEAELDDMQSRLKSLHPTTEKEENVFCCYAKSDKYWVKDPQGIAWETFHTLGALPFFGEDQKPDGTDNSTSSDQVVGAASCCIPSSTSSAASKQCC